MTAITGTAPTEGIRPVPVHARTIPELDGLRFLAIATVLLWHSSLRADRTAARSFDLTHGGGLYGWLPHGEIGVVLFFAISGLLVSRSFDLSDVPGWDVGRFYLRRFVRIYPPYLAALCACYLVLGVVGHVPTGANSFEQQGVTLGQSFVAGLAYLNGILFDAPSRLNPPMWSLEVEVQFYALLPLLMLACAWLARRRDGALVAASGMVALVLAISACSHWVAEDIRFRWGLLYHAPFFLAGIALSNSSALHRAVTAKSGAHDLLFLAGFLGLVILGYSMTADDARFDGSLHALVLETAGVAASVAAILGGIGGGMASRMMRARPLRLVGTMVYSVYLTHIVVMQAFAEYLPRFFRPSSVLVDQVVLVTVMVAASLACGWVFFVLVERPTLWLNAALARRPRRSVAPAGR